MMKALWLTATVIGLLVVLVASGILGSGGAVTSAAAEFSVEVDTDPTGNTGDSLGPTDFCRQISVGQSFEVDIVVKEAPPLFGVEVSLLYDPAVLRITAIRVNDGLFMSKIAGSSPANFSEPTPDEDGDFRAAVADFRNTGPSGDGTVFRFTIQAKAGGTSPFQIASDDPDTFFNEGPVVPDTENNPLSPLLSSGEIRVGQEACSASEPPPTPPPETPTDPGDQPTQTPEDTPRETDGTPQPSDGTPQPSDGTPQATGGSPGTTADTPQTGLLQDVSAEDSELTVVNAEVFQPGDIIQIEDEKLLVLSASGDTLVVERGVEGTEAEEHSGELTVSLVDDEQ